jgi:hypothetical protein
MEFNSVFKGLKMWKEVQQYPILNKKLYVHLFDKPQNDSVITNDNGWHWTRHFLIMKVDGQNTHKIK